MTEERIAHYRLAESIGKGGMGVVYRALDTRLRRTVALKLPSPHLMEDPRARKRFLLEAQTAASIEHPNICPIYDCGEDNGQMYLAMAFLQGTTLREAKSELQLTRRQRVAIICDVARGLTAIHAHGVVHRDIKPSNIMLDQNHSARILDFGLARVSDVSNITPSGEAVGTVSYMSPEHIRGEEVDSRADLFALGIVLYELVLGKHPFPGDNQASVIHSILNDQPAALSDSKIQQLGTLAPIIAKALEKSREERYATADEMRRDLEVWQEGSASSQAVTLPVKAKTQPRRRSARVLIVSLLVVSLFLVTVWLRPDPVPPNPQKRTGLVVLGASDDLATSTHRELAAGLVWDINRRAESIAASLEDGWVVPETWTRRFVATDPEDAFSLFGVQRVLSVSTRSLTGGTELSIASMGEPHLGPLNASVLIADTTTVDQIHHLVARVAWGTVQEQEPESQLDGAAYLSWARVHGSLLLNGVSAETLAQLAELANTHSTSALLLSSYAFSLRLQFEALGDSTHLMQAIQIAKLAITRDNSMASSHLTLALALEESGDAEQAQITLLNAIRELPRHAELQRQMADMYSRAGETQNAEGVHRQFVIELPHYVASHERLGAFLYRHGRYNEAIDPFIEAAILAPGYAKPFNYLGACYYALDCWPAATKMFRVSFDLGRSHLACANLATLLYMQGQFEEAARMYEWTLEYSPDDHETLGGLAAALYWLPGQREVAVQHYAEAANLAESVRTDRGDDPYLLSLLAGYYSISDPELAEPLLEEALAKAPGNPEVQYRAALAYEALGQRPKALIHLRDYVEKTSSHMAIEHEAFLDALRDDERYDLIIGNIQANNCVSETEARLQMIPGFKE